MIAFWEFFYHDLGKTYTDLALTPGMHRYANSRCHLSLSPKYQSQISSDPEGSQLFLAASLQDKRRPQGTGFLAWSQTSRASV